MRWIYKANIGEIVEIIGNWAYAGTQKFVSHALTADGKRTLCGMVVAELMARKDQQWEYEDADTVGCLKCKKRLAMLSAKIMGGSDEEAPQKEFTGFVLVTPTRYF